MLYQVAVIRIPRRQGGGSVGVYAPVVHPEGSTIRKNHFLTGKLRRNGATYKYIEEADDEANKGSRMRVT